MRLIPLVVCAAGCAGTAAEAPITTALALSRDETAGSLESHGYCHEHGPPATLETYPRCDRPGTEWGSSWITARFADDHLAELKRWERFSDDNRAIERWNQLVAARTKLSPPSDEALAQLRDHGLLEAGTRTVKAFRVDATTIAGVYLLSPTPPQEASVLEAIIRVPGR